MSALAITSFNREYASGVLRGALAAHPQPNAQNVILTSLCSKIQLTRSASVMTGNMEYQISLMTKSIAILVILPLPSA